MMQRSSVAPEGGLVRAWRRLSAVGTGVVVATVLAGCTVPLPEGGSDLLERDEWRTGQAPAEGMLRVHYVDVGQGDGVVWELPGGEVVVYDCGPPARSADENPVVVALRGLGLGTGARVHALIASHGHLDHIGGCEEVLAEYRVAHLYEAWYDGADAPASYKAFQEQVRAEGGNIHVLAETGALDGEAVFQAGDPLMLPAEAEAAGVRSEILWPPAFQDDDWDGIAASSIAVRLSFGEVAFCFQGDVEAAQEAAMVERLAGRGCEVYLVGHHGSRYASSAAWLEAMAPNVAVVSFGKNGYGHPTPEALCHVQEAGAAVYATHRVGTVVVEADGVGVEIQSGLPETRGYCESGADDWTRAG